METKKIRIGNDIRLAVDLRQYIDIKDLGYFGYLSERKVYNPYDLEFCNKDSNDYVNTNEVYYPNQQDSSSNNTNATEEYIKNFRPDGTPIGIRQVKAFIINKTKKKEREDLLKKKSRFISRYPIEPIFDAFHSTQYDVCNSGYPTYRAYPRCYGMMPYHGFGVNPNWDSIYKKLPVINDLEYRAEVSATKYQHIIEVIFPADALLYTGTYDLVIVAKIYAPGFNINNTKTITVDVPDVFQLTSSTDDGIDTGIKIYVGNVIDILGVNDEPMYRDIYTNSGNYSNNNISLTRTDGNIVTVDTSEFTDWYTSDY